MFNIFLDFILFIFDFLELLLKDNTPKNGINKKRDNLPYNNFKR